MPAGGRFFGWYGGADRLIDRYFEAARFWRDIAYVMALTPSRLMQVYQQAMRIAKLERPRG